MKNTFFRYFIIGTLTVLIDYSILLLLSTLGIRESIGNIFSVTVSVVFNFLMQNYRTFKSGKRNKLQKSIKYLVLTIFNYFFNIVAFFILFDRLKIEKTLSSRISSFLSVSLLDGLITKFIIAITIMCWNYFLFKYWVFVKGKKLNEPS